MKQEPIIRRTYFDAEYYQGLEAAPQERRFSRRRRFHVLVWLALALAVCLLILSLSLYYSATGLPDGGVAW